MDYSKGISVPEDHHLAECPAGCQSLYRVPQMNEAKCLSLREFAFSSISEVVSEAAVSDLEGYKP